MASLIKRGAIYYVKYTDTDGKQRRISTKTSDETRAQSIADAFERQVSADQGVDASAAMMTVAQYSGPWLDLRERDGVSSIRDERGRFTNYIIPALGAMLLVDVRVKHVRDFVRALKRTELAPRTIHNIYGTLRTMFRDASIDELIPSNPIGDGLGRGVLPKQVDKDPNWRAGAIFTRTEAEILISDVRIPHDRRVFHAILIFTGCRFGEAAALTWADYERELAPLGRLSISKSFDHRTHKVKRTKTEVPRQVPVHPTLATILAEWRGDAGPGDLIVPNRDGAHRNVNRACRSFHADLDRLDMRERRQHDLRRTLISLAQVDGAKRELLKTITHGNSKAIMDVYSSFPWSALCDQIAPINIGRLDSVAPQTLGPVQVQPLEAFDNSSEKWCERQGLNL